MKSTPAIDLRGLKLTLTGAAGPVHILRGIDLTIEPGETVGLVGPSGSGKTSLLLTIAGLERITEGTIRAVGQDLSALDEDGLARFRRKHVGIVFQDFHLVPTMTALENVALPLEFAGDDHAFERARAQLDSVGLARRVGHYPSQLSGGEQQRVALARAFVTEPSILLADEPTGNLDGETGAAVMDVLFELHRRLNTTLLLITHAPALAQKCHRLLRLVDGHIAGDSAAVSAAGRS